MTATFTVTITVDDPVLVEDRSTTNPVDALKAELLSHLHSVPGVDAVDVVLLEARA